MGPKKILYKSVLSAYLIAIGIILSRFFSIPGLFGFSFLKIGFTMSIIFFSSFYLGPVYGMLISFLIDLIGALIIPQGGAYDPLYSIPAILEGLFPALFCICLSKLKYQKIKPYLYVILLIVLNISVDLFLLNRDSFKMSINSTKIYELTTTIKISLISIFFVSSLLSLIVIYLLDKKKILVTKKYNIYDIASSILLTYFLIKIPSSSLVTIYRLNYTFEVVFFTKTAASLFTYTIHLFIVLILLNVGEKLRDRNKKE